MKRWYKGAMYGAVCGLLLSPTVMRAQTAPEKIDTLALGALRDMSEYLRTLDTFQVIASITTEAVLVDSQKVQTAKNVDMVVNRPNKLRLQLTGDQHERLFIFDGTSFSLYAPRMKYYATVPAQGTLNELANKLEDKHGIELPLVDLFRWGTPEAALSLITAAKNIGPSQCGGVTCQHYAFRQDGLDWEIWIQNGDYPLPRRVVLNTLTDEARPQHTATYTWNLAPSFDDEAFVFVAPTDSKKITLAELPGQTSAQSD